MVRPRFAMLATAVSALLSLPGVAAATDTVGLVDTTSGRWHLRTADAATASFFYGSPGDVPFAGDWDCDGVDTPGLYRPSDGFVYLRNSNTQGVADLEYYFGDPGDVPLAGDFDGDGCDTVSLYRPSEQRFYVIDRLGSGTTGLGAADFSFLFGNPDDRPFVADVDGDGIDEVALHRPSTGLVYYRTTLTTGVADASFIFGDPGDAILGGDWTGDGVDTVGIFRPDGSGFYLRHSNTAGFADAREVFGDPSWEPVSGDFGPLQGVPDLALRTVVSGLDRPVFLDAPAGDPRLFVVEQGGTIRVVSGDAVLPTPFLTVPVSTGGERGLLGLAFHPGYAANGRLFVMYTDPGGDSVVAEYHAAPGADVADPAPVRTVLTVDQPAANHNGGMLAFGPDGYLYVGLGDGGGADDTFGNAQDTGTLLGSILRLDVDGAAPYAVPADNPLVGRSGRDEIWVWGLRNPWRFSFDAVTGDMLIGDVGQDAAEEIDLATSGGANFGWPVREGGGCRAGSPCASAGLTAPIHEYRHPEGCSVTGGYVYRGAALPALQGTYFYSDFCTGWIRSFRVEAGAATDHREWTSLGSPGRVVSFGTDGSGEMYVLTIDGTVREIVAG
jgi:glucose/arabinose dehydrogenase